MSTEIVKTYLEKALQTNVTKIPWDSLKYLIGEVIYGGRVIDSFDRRITQTYMDEYLGDFVFDEYQSFYFYTDSNFDYKIPDALKTKDDFLSM